MMNEPTPPRLRLSRGAMFLITVGIALLALFDGFLIYFAISGGPGHDDVIAEVEAVRQQIVEINCVAFVPVSERTDLRLAECRTNPTEGP